MSPIIDIHAREILKLRARMNEILAHHTGRTVEEIARDTERDYHLTAEEALDYGLIDRVVSQREDAAPAGSNGSASGSGKSGSGDRE